MARPIKLTKDQIMTCLKDIYAELTKARMTDSGLSINKKYYLDGSHKCTVQYTQKAWYKTIMLIDQNVREVGWYGVCHRDEEDPALFLVSDIMVYPQKVTGTTIDPDPIEFVNWENGLDDETFNHMRIHVHSHVNMGVTPSSVDQKFRDDRLSQLHDDDFMIFQIMNKRWDISSAVYDFKLNIFYEDRDVSTVVECDDMNVWKAYKTIGSALMDCDTARLQEITSLFMESGMKEFLDDADSVVRVEYQTGYYGGSGQYNGKGYYNGGHNGGGAGYTGYRVDDNSTGAGTGTGKSAGNIIEIAPSGEKTVVTDAGEDDGYDDVGIACGDEYLSAAEEYLRGEYGDTFFEKYGEQIMADPFFAAGELSDIGYSDR